ncbi:MULTISPECIES: alpha-glucosidase C-terminal domain-containing protein [Paenibacillus]|uniref:alpha-glucosidase C-terminal domain-containing protein n=1 Tax=Paenibacillus TaxID=44249 RepID=UPI003873BB9B
MYRERSAQGADPAELLQAIHAKRRDNALTPFQWAYLRKLGEERWLLLLNFSEGRVEFELHPELGATQGELLIGNYSEAAGERVYLGRVPLRPYEAKVYRLL